MKNFVQPGLSVPMPMPYDRTSGQGVLVGALFGVVAVDALTGVTAEVAVNGVFDITKEAPLVIAVGARVADLPAGSFAAISVVDATQDSLRGTVKEVRSRCYFIPEEGKKPRYIAPAKVILYRA